MAVSTVVVLADWLGLFVSSDWVLRRLGCEWVSVSVQGADCLSGDGSDGSDFHAVDDLLLDSFGGFLVDVDLSGVGEAQGLGGLSWGLREGGD